MKRICVVTGTRADYGLLYWLMKEIEADESLKLQIIATGTHLSPEFGLTYKVLENDGFTIDTKIEMLLSSDTSIGITKSVGLAVIGFADALDSLKPDMIVVLGDRYEILAAAQSALLAKIPVVHLHGGEITEGAVDESIRHAITKMSNLHFVGAGVYRNRVIQMGEDPANVYNFGAPGLDQLTRISFLDKFELETELNFNFTFPLFLVTYHPVTLGSENSFTLMSEFLSALEHFQEASIIFTYPNADVDGRIIIDLINSFVSKNTEKRRAFASLGQRRYLSLMKLSDLVIGNSSSGVIEAPALKKACINIGDRQKGRLKASSVIDCDDSAHSIVQAIREGLTKEFQNGLSNVISLYGSGDVSPKIKNILKNFKLESRKSFYDIQF